MTDGLDVSIHGAERIDLIERIVHACRYTPGLIVIEEDLGRSPVVFLRHMAELLRDELDLALIDTGTFCTTDDILGELLQQWFVYKSLESVEGDLQLIHHYLDVARQGGQLALIAVQQANVLDDECLALLFRLISRHSNLSLLLCGVADATQFTVRAKQLEVPVSLIDFSDVKKATGPQLSRSVMAPVGGVSSSNQAIVKGAGGHPTVAVDEDDGISLFAERDSSHRPVSGRGSEAGFGHANAQFGDAQLGISRRLSAVTDWAGDTCSRIVKIGSPDLGRVYAVIFALFVLSCLVWGVSLFVSGEDAELPGDVGELSTIAQQTLPAQPEPPPVIGGAYPASVPEPVNEHSGNDNNEVIQEKPGGQPPPVADNRVDVVAVRQPDVTEATQPDPTSGATIQSSLQPSAANRAPRQGPAHNSLAWWKAKSSNYTIQIASAHNENNIKELAKQLPQSQPFLIYPGRREGKPWFVLLYGSFTTREDAASALTRLAPAIQTAGPAWIRKQGDVINK